jgi:U4/U6 small nuclear ribonucleoprotein PRP4
MSFLCLLSSVSLSLPLSIGLFCALCMCVYLCFYRYFQRFCRPTSTPPPTASTETLELSEDAQRSKERHEELIRQMEAKRRAHTITVPTNDGEVRRRLRQLGEAICLFGEGPAERRLRLRELLAHMSVEDTDRLQALEEQTVAGLSRLSDIIKKKIIEPVEIKGPQALREARIRIAHDSVARASKRTSNAHALQQRLSENDHDRIADNEKFSANILHFRKFFNYFSEVGDKRPLSSCAFAPESHRNLVVGSWSGDVTMWAVPSGQPMYHMHGHRERVVDVAFHPSASVNSDTSSCTVASAGADEVAMLWACPLVPGIQSNAESESDENMSDANANSNSNGSANNTADTPMSDATSTVSSSSSVKKEHATAQGAVPIRRPLLTLAGHTDRLGRIAFHPSGTYLGTTSFDRTWRLWDIEKRVCLLAQSGHYDAVYGIAYHPDGSIVGTSDLSGVGLLWDLRSGRMIVPLVAHAKQVLSLDFAPNGYEIATASDDHTVKLWDLRKRKVVYTLAAHNNVISTVKYDPSGEFLLTTSYDCEAKLWSMRDHSLVKVLAGHQSRIMAADISADCEFISTVSYDRTWKLWAHEDTI